MKRHIQKTGVRKFFGQDFVDLQAEPLKALDAFFAEYGQCIIQGCTIAQAEGDTFDVAPGLVALESTDPESGAVAIRTMPFAGAAGVALPLYLAAQWVVAERAYGDGKVKPIAYDLLALASGVEPEAPHLALTAAGGDQFVDAVQDGTHRFVSDAERAKWNDILRQAKEYAATQAATAAASAQATAVGLAKAHTDATAAAVRDELAVGDASTLVGAKQYADRIVAALIDGSPEMLNTLQELAAALGGDPNFATTVMTEISKRVTNTNFNAHTANVTHVTTGERNAWNSKLDPSALNGKANVGHTHSSADVSNVFQPIADNADQDAIHQGISQTGVRGTVSFFQHSYNELQFDYPLDPRYPQDIRYRVRNNNTSSWLPWHVLYNVGNLGRATAAADGLMASADKAKLDTLAAKIIRGSVTAAGYSGGGNADSVGLVTGESAMVRIIHNLGTTAYSATATAVSNTNGTSTDNVVSAWRKSTNYVDFVVTAGPNGEREMCAFDYLIIPY